jgi:tetratricopeptide (TPR) repeat protein
MGEADEEREAREARERGNALHKGCELERATSEYTRALEHAPADSEERAKAFANRAASQLSLNRPHDALSDCNAALSERPQYVRALERAARCHECIASDDPDLSDADRDSHRSEARSLRQTARELSQHDAPVSPANGSGEGSASASRRNENGFSSEKGESREDEEATEEQKRQAMQSLKDLGNMVLNPFGMSTEDFEVKQDPETGSYSIASAKKGSG